MEIKLIVTDLDGTLLTKRMKCTLTYPSASGAARNEDKGMPRDGKKLEGRLRPVLEQVAFDEVAALNNGGVHGQSGNGRREHQLVFSKENVQGMVETICRLPYTFLSLMGTDYMHVLETSGKNSHGLATMMTRNANRWGFERFPMPGCW